MEIKSVEILTPLWVTYQENNEDKNVLVYFNPGTREIHYEGSTTEKVQFGINFERQLVDMIDPVTETKLPQISSDIWNQIDEVKSGKTEYFGFNKDIK